MTDTEILDCPHGERCGGCAFLSVPYAEQLARKHAFIERAFVRYPELAPLRVAEVSGASPTRAYRARAKLVFGGGGSLGLYERDSHSVVDIPECRVLAPALSRVAAAARRVSSGKLPALDALDLREVDDGVLVTLIAPRGTPIPELKRLAQALRAECSDVRSVAASFREAGAATVLGSNHVLLEGSEVERHHSSASGPYHLAAHGAFTQAHLGQANRAHGAFERALKERKAQRVLELYAGSGALSLRLARAGFSLTAVEAFAPALAHAERAAREQSLQLTTISGTAERALGELGARGAKFDALILNPPRRGLSPEVRRSAAALAPSAILYMSCDPSTLARDLEHLRILGYSTPELWPFDMIPHSAAVECLLVAERGPAPAPKVLYEDERLIAVLKSGYEALPRLAAEPEAIPLMTQQLDADSSGVCLFARNKAALHVLEQAFRAGAQSFVGLVRGVSHKRGRIRRPLREGRRVAPASIRYLREGLRGGHSLLTVWPDQCGALQLRQLLAGVGHPVLGDTRFGDAASNTFFEHRHGLDRSFLHCSSTTLAFEAGPLTVEAPLPGELAAVLASLAEPAATPG